MNWISYVFIRFRKCANFAITGKGSRYSYFAFHSEKFHSGTQQFSLRRAICSGIIYQKRSSYARVFPEDFSLGEKWWRGTLSRARCSITIANSRTQVGHDANSRVHLCSRATDGEARRRSVHRKRMDLRHNGTMNFSRRHFATERKKRNRERGEREWGQGRGRKKERKKRNTIPQTRELP